MPTRLGIENTIKALLARYNAEYALLFGSYAGGEETPDSDIDVVVFGGDNFKKSNIFAFAEELREAPEKEANVFDEMDDFVESIKSLRQQNRGKAVALPRFFGQADGIRFKQAGRLELCGVALI